MTTPPDPKPSRIPQLMLRDPNAPPRPFSPPFRDKNARGRLMLRDRKAERRATLRAMWSALNRGKPHDEAACLAFIESWIKYTHPAKVDPAEENMRIRAWNAMIQARIQARDAARDDDSDNR